MLLTIDNSLFNESKSISSSLAVAGRLGNNYVVNADPLLKKEDLITPYQYGPNYREPPSG